jgi:hypothetical protein
MNQSARLVVALASSYHGQRSLVLLGGSWDKKEPFLARGKCDAGRIVEWRGYRVSRLILGHNPIKGHSHFSKELDAEMEEWFRDRQRGVDLLKRCRERGVNTVQFGHGTEDILSAACEEGIVPNWIATVYNDPQGRFGRTRFPPRSVEEELQSFKSVHAKLIGYQLFGESTDYAFLHGQLETRVGDTIKWLRDRDPDRLIGVCTRLPEVVRAVDERQWPVDFQQTCLYTVYVDRSRKMIDRHRERFDPDAREEMFKAVKSTRLPCIVFKVLAA